MTVPGIEMLAEVVAERAVNSIFGGLLIAAFAWLVLRLVGKQNSRTRFAVWFSALVVIAGLPFVTGLRFTGMVSHPVRAEFTVSSFWAIAICSVWIVFAAVAAVRMLLGLLSLRGLRKSGVALVSSELHPAVREVVLQCQKLRPVAVCSSSAVSVPTAIGFFKPAILLPEWALRDLPAEELKVILLHEFAHLRRWDDWTNLAQKVIRGVFFFHPAVWWIEKRLSLEREMACDDAVLAETNNPRAYAECLVSLAEKNFVKRGLAMAQAAISRTCETSARLAQILDADRPQATRLFKPALGLMTAIAGVCLIVLPDAPKFIAFENSVQPQSVAAAKEVFPRQAQALVKPVSMRTNMVSAAKSGRSRVAATQAVFHPSKPAEGKSRQHPVAAVPVALRNSQAQAFLVVMHSAEFDEEGSVVFRVSVWELTVINPHRNAVQPEVLAKSI